jgi:hypothetical protein
MVAERVRLRRRVVAVDLGEVVADEVGRALEAGEPALDRAEHRFQVALEPE